MKMMTTSPLITAILTLVGIFPLMQCRPLSLQCSAIDDKTDKIPGAACKCENDRITARYDKNGTCVTCFKNQFFNGTSYLCESCPGTIYNIDPNVRPSCKDSPNSSNPPDIPPSSNTITTVTVTAPTTTATVPTLPSTPTQAPPGPAAKSTKMTQLITDSSRPTTSDSVSISQNTSAINQNAPNHNILNEHVMDLNGITILIILSIVVVASVGIDCKFRISRKIKKLCCPKNENRDGKAEEEEKEHLDQKDEEISQTEV